MNYLYNFFRVSCIIVYVEVILVITYQQPWINTFAVLPLVYIIAYIIFNIERPLMMYDYTSLFKENVDKATRLDILKHTNVNPNTIFIDGESVLMKAVKLEDMDLVRYLVRDGASLDYTDNSGFTVLSYSIETGNQDITRFLLESGSVPDEKAMECAYKGPEGLNPYMVKILRDHGGE